MAQYAQLQPGMQPAPLFPAPRSYVEKGRRYELQVVQQPRRARMCGFGDKDRRPITPPPCVRLIITDVSTGKEVDCNEIDHGMFVLNVDLWSEDGQREVNLVRHSNSAPAVGNTIPVSYAQLNSDDNYIAAHGAPPPGQQAYNGAPPYNPYPQGGPPQVNPYAQQQGQPQQALPSPPYDRGQYQPGYAPTTNGNQYPPQNGYPGAPPAPQQFYSGARIHSQGHVANGPPVVPGGSAEMGGFPSHEIRNVQIAGGARGPVSNTAPTGMFTRNLIGSLAASAFRLTDPDDRIGIWFVLQDLSVRTEGHFRLRFSFVNVGQPTTPPPSAGSGGPSIVANQVNTGRAPVLAACFSEVFTVYSAKKFPGVVESTHLSKCFATQGIKIPIRKDGPGGKKDGREEYDED